MAPAVSSARAHERVVVVVVAWNRRDLLRQTLDGLASQTRSPDVVLVIDNASTDDSAAVARAHPVVTQVVTLPTNTGGAGGFAAGIATAVADHSAGLVWVMDDDTVPTPSALAELLAVRAAHPRRLALLASRADWTDGREHPMNTPRTRPAASRRSRTDAARLQVRLIRSASFVSILIDAAAVLERGLPRAAYFLWNDDFEYTSRLLRRHEGVYVPASRVRHLTRTFGDSSADPGPRFHLEVRNKVWLFTRSRALAPWEKVLYGGSTLLRWVRTFATSTDRSVLARGLAQGLREGLGKPPTTSQVLAGTPVAASVAQIESGVPA